MATWGVEKDPSEDVGLARQLTDALDPLSTEEGKARAHLLYRKIAPRR
jgi:hypothetical protein